MEIKKITSVTGSAIPIRGDDIDTDQIIPARFMKGITFEGLGEHVFRAARFTEDGKLRGHPFNDKRYAGGTILIVNKNFGCGSSREHAPQALMRWGIRALIGESFGDIFAGNCTVLGIPAVTVREEDVEALIGGVEKNSRLSLTIDVSERRITGDGFNVSCGIAESARTLLINGLWDSTALLLQAQQEIRKTAQSLPYVSQFIE